MSDTSLTLFVHPAHYPWLITAALDVMYESDLDFDLPSFSTLVPASGELDVDGPHRYEARTEIRRRLETVGVNVSEVRVAH